MFAFTRAHALPSLKPAWDCARHALPPAFFFSLPVTLPAVPQLPAAPLQGALTAAFHIRAATPSMREATQPAEGSPIPTESPESHTALYFVHCPAPDNSPSLREFPAGFVPGDGQGLGPASSALEAVERDVAFGASAYFSALKTERMGRHLILGRTMPSTQALVAQNRSCLPEGAACVALTQSAGKGRGRNSWQSPEGCLLFSALVTERDGRKLPLFQYVVALAIVKATDVICKRRQHQALRLPLFIKWPNDIYTKEAKLGGILCNSTYSDKMFSVVAGVGLNVSNSQPTTCINELLRREAPSAAPVAREEILAEFFNEFEALHRTFANEGFRVLEPEYTARWLHSDQEVLLKVTEGTTADSPALVTIKGLTPDGYLLAVDASGAKFELSPDGNSFDFFHGLIGRRVPS